VIPELDRTVHYEQDSATKEYAIDYHDLVDVKILPESQALDQHTCADWRKAAKEGHGSSVPASAYQEGKWSFKVQVLRTNQEAIAKAFNRDWTNVSNYETSSAKLELAWSTAAATSIAGAQVNFEVTKELNTSLNSSTNRQSLNTSGVAVVTSSYPLFACDLWAGNVDLKLTYDAVQYGSFHSGSALKATDLVELSRRMIDSASIISGSKANMLTNEAAQLVNAAGLLAFELKRQGYNSTVIQSGDFLRIYDRLFDGGPTRPSVLSTSQAETFVNSMGQTEYEPSPIHIEQSISFNKEQ
jgi:hypothetical protein